MLAFFPLSLFFLRSKLGVFEEEEEEGSKISQPGRYGKVQTVREKLELELGRYDISIEVVNGYK